MYACYKQAERSTVDSDVYPFLDLEEEENIRIDKFEEYFEQEHSHCHAAFMRQCRIHRQYLEDTDELEVSVDGTVVYCGSLGNSRAVVDYLQKLYCDRYPYKEMVELGTAYANSLSSSL